MEEREGPPVGQRGRVRRHAMPGKTVDRATAQLENADSSRPRHPHTGPSPTNAAHEHRNAAYRAIDGAAFSAGRATIVVSKLSLLDTSSTGPRRRRHGDERFVLSTFDDPRHEFGYEPDLPKQF